MDHHNLLTLKLGTFKGLGPLGGEDIALDTGDKPFTLFTDIISLIIGVMTIVAFIWFVIVLLLGAIAWLSSSGDKTKLQEAQKQITTGLTGLLIVVSAVFIVKIIESVLGIKILALFDLLKSLTP